jgi:N-acyl homoserine lactone hydrolase
MSIQIHAIQTGTVQVKTAFLRGAVSAGGTLAYLVELHRDYPYIDLPIYAWAIEHPEGVIVVDAGDIPSDKKTWLIQTTRTVRPEDEIGAQLLRLGIRPDDVAKVVLTHLHSDHANGVRSFPRTPIFISETEYQSFHSRAGRFINRLTLNVPANFSPQFFRFRPERFGTFDASYPLTKAGDVVAVPTPGHTRGHLSVIVRDGGISYFLAGDVTYDEAALLAGEFQGPCETVEGQRDTLARVLRYTQENATVYLPAHDPASGERLAAQTVPATVFA